MRQVMLVAHNVYAPLYLELQAKYAVRFMAQVTTLRQAALLLNGQATLPELVILGPDLSPAGQVVEFVRKAQTSSALRQVKFVVLLDQNAAFLAGELTGLAQTLVFQDTTPASLAALLNASPVRQGRTTALAVINVKGGTGKTSLLVNLGDALARRGLKTVLLDADVVDGNVAQALGLKSGDETLDRLGSEIARGREVNELIPRYLVQRRENLYVLPAPGRSDYNQDNLNEVTAGAIFNALVAQRFDLILIDLPGNVRATPFISTMAAYPHAYFYLLYPTGRAFGQKGFTGATQIVHGLASQERSRVVVYDSGTGGEAWSEPEFVRQHNLPVAGVIPYDPLVEQSQRAGQTAAEYVAAQGRMFQARRAVSRFSGGGRDYLAELEKLADWVQRHDLAEAAV
jgi:Mrp family chromosome partitioning ATPase